MTPNRKRVAQEMAATMDHSDIRGLVTAFHLFLAVLPRSRSWEHHRDARIKPPEDSPHGSCASRYRFGMELSGGHGAVGHLQKRCVVKAKRSCGDVHLPSDVPNEAWEFSGDPAYTAFVLRHLSAGMRFAQSIRQSQLGLPSDVAYDFGLANIGA
jgi:hypothetical protein